MTIFKRPISESSKQTQMENPVFRIGISACLLGQAVRYDGGHKRNPFLLEKLAPFATWVAVCPETELGLGIPRETIGLYGSPEAPMLLANDSECDHTTNMQKWSNKRLQELEKEDLSGFILKSRSPSCGLFNVKVFEEKGSSVFHSGRGLFARALTDRWPLLPIAEESQLERPEQLEEWVEKLFLYEKWKKDS